MIIDNRQKAVMLFLCAVARSKALKAKQAAMAMDCKKAMRGKAAVSEAKAEKGSTGNRPPSSPQENTQMSSADAYAQVMNDHSMVNSTIKNTTWTKEDITEVQNLYSEFDKLHPDKTNVTSQEFQQFANEKGLNDTQKIYLAGLIAYNNPNFATDSNGTTHCTELVSYTNYLITGDENVKDIASATKLANYLTSQGYVSVNALNGKEMQELVNSGIPVYAIVPGEHSADVMPGDSRRSNNPYNVEGNNERLYFPAIAQAGNNTLIYGVMNTIQYSSGPLTKDTWQIDNGFGSYVNQVQYYYKPK